MYEHEEEFIDETQPGVIYSEKRKKTVLHDEEKGTAAALYKTLFYRQTRLFKNGHETYLSELIAEKAQKMSLEDAEKKIQKIAASDPDKQAKVDKIMAEAESLKMRLTEKARSFYMTLCEHLNTRNQIIMDKRISSGHRKLAQKKEDLKALYPWIKKTNTWSAVFKIFDELAVIKPVKFYNDRTEKTEKCFILNFLYCATKINYSTAIIKPFWEFNRPWLQKSIKAYLDYYYGEGHKEKDIDDKTICDYTGLNYNDLVGTEEAQAG